MLVDKSIIFVKNLRSNIWSWQLNNLILSSSIIKSYPYHLLTPKNQEFN